MIHYYFITYSAKNKYAGTIHIWNAVTDIFPIQWLLAIRDDTYYTEFSLINYVEISEETYLEFKGKF